MILLTFALGACTASGDEVAPPNDALFFPTGLAIAPDDSVLFVANANAELRYDSGTVDVLDLGLVDQVVSGWTGHSDIPDGCTQDGDHRETLTCEEAPFIRAGAGIRIGNFATDIAVQDTGGGTLRLIVPTRGDPSIAWANYDGDHLACSDSEAQNALCDDLHRLSYVDNNADFQPLPDEPFSAYADSAGQYAVVTHLTNGAVSLINSPKDGPAVLTDVVSGIFEPDASTGLIGATGVAGRPNGSNGSLVYVGSRSEDRIQMFSVGHPVNDADPFLLLGNFFFLDGVGNNANGSTDTRGMKFSASGDRLYLVNRNPATLQIIDTSENAGGFPKNKTIAASPICRAGSTLAVMDAGAGDRAYVSCFQDGEIFVVDPRGESSVEDVILAGRGPYAVAAAPSRKKLYVTNFLEDTVAVIDVDPLSPTHDRVVLRIGTIRPL